MSSSGPEFVVDQHQRAKQQGRDQQGAGRKRQLLQRVQATERRLGALVQARSSQVGLGQSSRGRGLLPRCNLVSRLSDCRRPEVRAQQPHHQTPPARPPELPDSCRMGRICPGSVARLRREEPDRYRGWIKHLRTALPDLADIATFERPEDKHCYMIYEYAGGLKVPSWLVSDGTLRLTALTLPAYLVDLQGIYLIEEAGERDPSEGGVRRL